MKYRLLLLMAVCSTVYSSARVRPHHLFADDMVIQREKPVKVWGWASPGEKVEVLFSKQIKKTVTNAKGEWSVYLDPLKASAVPQDLTITGEDQHVFRNILVGDIWVLGGQSNMELDLDRIYHGDLEVASAHYNQIRLMTIPKASGIMPVTDFTPLNEYDSWLDRYDKKGYWFTCSPQTVKTFSAMGYIFGRRLHQATQIPIGLIDVSIGGTTLEAWLSPAMLQSMRADDSLLADWNQRLNSYDPVENLKKKISNWEKRSEARRKQGLDPNPKPTEPDPSPALDRNFPGASYNGLIAAVAGFAVKGVIFNQGYNNALSPDARPALYAKNFIALIKDWRNSFEDQNLPFGIIELSAGGLPQTMDNYETAMLDAAPFIREGQFKAYQAYTHTGFVAIYDQQENWYHPRKKAEGGERMARWALETEYQMEMGWKPATCVSAEKNGTKMLLRFSKEIRASDDRPFEGFAIAGADGHFYPAQAVYYSAEKDKAGNDIPDKSKLLVWSELVPNPEAVRYAWARNPIANAVNDDIRERMIPVPAFRTDKWDYPEAPYRAEDMEVYSRKMNEIRRQAIQQTQQRKQQELQLLIKKSGQ
jgi:sialate O-acetylesterase